MKVKKNLFNDLFNNLTIFNKTVNENETVNKNKTVNENENKSDDESDYENDNKDDNLTNKDENYYKIKLLNNWFETIDQTKSLDEQRELFKRKDFLNEYWYVKYYHDNKELNYKIFKAKAAYLLNDLDEQLFKEVFGHTFVELVEKLINTVDKEENQIIIDDIKNNKK